MKMGQAMTIKVAMADAIGCLGKIEKWGETMGKLVGILYIKEWKKHIYI